MLIYKAAIFDYEWDHSNRPPKKNIVLVHQEKYTHEGASHVDKHSCLAHGTVEIEVFLERSPPKVTPMADTIPAPSVYSQAPSPYSLIDPVGHPLAHYPVITSSTTYFRLAQHTIQTPLYGEDMTKRILKVIFSFQTDSRNVMLTVK